MKIGAVDLDQPFALAPMAGMTDTAFPRLVKRRGGCGLVVSEMVSSEGLVRGIDRTLEYAEYTEEERPVSIQVFGGDPEKMARAAQIVEGKEEILRTGLAHRPDAALAHVLEHVHFARHVHVDDVDARSRRGGHLRYPQGRFDSARAGPRLPSCGDSPAPSP